MSQGDFFAVTEIVEPGDKLSVDGSSASTGAVEIHTFLTENAVTVKKEFDTDENGEYDATGHIVKTDSAIHSQKNKIEVSSSKNMKLTIKNESDGSQLIHLTGIEVND